MSQSQENLNTKQPWAKRVTIEVGYSEKPQYTLDTKKFDETLSNADKILEISNQVLDTSKPQQLISSFPQLKTNYFSPYKKIRQNHDIIVGNSSNKGLQKTILQTYEISANNNKMAIIHEAEFGVMTQSLQAYLENLNSLKKPFFASSKKREEYETKQNEQSKHVNDLIEDISKFRELSLLRIGSNPEEILESAHGIKEINREDALEKLMPRMLGKDMTEIRKQSMDNGKTLNDLFNEIQENVSTEKAVQDNHITIQGYKSPELDAAAKKIIEHQEKDLENKTLELEKKLENNEYSNPQKIFNSFLKSVEWEFENTRKTLDNNIESASLCTAFLNSVYVSKRTTAAEPQNSKKSKKDINPLETGFKKNQISNLFSIQPNSNIEPEFGEPSNGKEQNAEIRLSPEETKITGAIITYLKATLQDIEDGKKSLMKYKQTYEKILSKEEYPLFAEGKFESTEIIHGGRNS